MEQHLEKQKCVVLVGKEGSGKTEMAVHLMLKYSEKNYCVRKVHNAHDCLSFFDPLGKIFIFADDLFDCSDGGIKEWWRTFNLLQTENRDTEMFDQKQNDCEIYTVFSSRPQKLKDAQRKMRFNNDLLSRHTIYIDTENSLKSTEKKEILLKKMEFARDVRQINETQFKEEEWQFIYNSSPPFGFPLCARLFACDKSYRKAGVHFFSNPQEFVLKKVKKIIGDDTRGSTEVLFVLILIHQIQGEPFICSNTEKSWAVLCELQIDKALKLKKERLDNLHDVLPDHNEVYIRESEESELQFIHPSVQEAVEQYFFETCTEKAIEILPLPMLYKKLHDNENLESQHFESIVCRLHVEIKKQNVCEVFTYQAFKDKNFSQHFVEHITQNIDDFINILSTKDAKHNFPFIYWFTKAVNNETAIDLLNHKMMNHACSATLLYDQYYFALLASCLSQEMKDITEYILERYSDRDIQNDFRDNINKSVFKHNSYISSPLLEAANHHNEHAIQIFLKNKATFPHTTWKGWPFLHACYKEKQIGCSAFLMTLYEMEETILKNENEHDLKYEDVGSENFTFCQKVVITIKKSYEKHGTLQHILLDLIEIPELEVTDSLIKAFCSLSNFTELHCTDPLNCKDDKGNSVLHLFVKNCGSSQEDCIDCIYEDDFPEIGECTTGNDIEQLKIETNEIGNDFSKDSTTRDPNKILQTLTVLYNNYIDFNTKNKIGLTPLMIELSKKSPSKEIVELLLKFGANPNDKDSLGRTSVHLLLSHSLQSPKSVHDCLMVLIKYEADVNIKDKSGNNPMFVELRRPTPRLQILSGLLAGDIDMNSFDVTGRTPLEVAMNLPNTNNRKKDIIQVLLRSKNLRFRTEGDSSFRMAVSELQTNRKILKMLANHESCKYPLHECIKANVGEREKIDALQFLLSNDDERFNVNHVNDEKETLLITAVKLSPDMHNLVDFLLEKKININAEDNTRKTALDYLVESEQTEWSRRNYVLNRILSEKPKVTVSLLSGAMWFIVNTSYLSQADAKDVQFAMEDKQSATSSKQEKEDIISSKECDVKVPHIEQKSNTYEQNLFIVAEIVAKILKILETNPVWIGENKKERTYLHYCVSSQLGDKHVLPICQRLVELGLNVDDKDKDGKTCIDMAFKFNGRNYETLAFLLENSCLQELDIDASLENLADMGHLTVDIVEYLEKNVFSRIKPKRNILHYLATINLQRGSETERLFSYLHESSLFPVKKKNDYGKLPLHIAVESNISVNCVMCFLKISLEFVNEKDRVGNTPFHLVLKSNRIDVDVCAIVKEMLEHNADMNERNELGETPLMVAVTCSEDRSITIAEILKHQPDLTITDRKGFTILHHCIEGPKDDFKSCTLLSLFLESACPVPLNLKSSEGLTVLNLAARNGERSRILCILKLLQSKEVTASTVDEVGRNPLHYTADRLKGENPLTKLERLIRSYIFFVHGTSPELKADDKRTVFKICREKKYKALLELFETQKNDTDDRHKIIEEAWLDVATKRFEKNKYSFEDVLKWNKATSIEEKVKYIIKDSLPYLCHCEFDKLKNVEKDVDDNSSSSVELEESD